MIKIIYCYKSKDNIWREYEFETDSVVKAVRFIWKCKTTKNYLFRAYMCFDAEDSEYIECRI